MEIKIDTEFIKLGNFLKYANIVDSGGVAKVLIQDGEILVNGEVAYERGKKLYPGDIVQFNDEEYKVI